MDGLIVIIGIIFWVAKQVAKQKEKAQLTVQKRQTPAPVISSPDTQVRHEPEWPSSMEGIDPCHDEETFISMEGIDPCHEEERELALIYEEEAAAPPFPVFTKESLLQGVIMAEILNRPMKKMGRRGA